MKVSTAKIGKRMAKNQQRADRLSNKMAQRTAAGKSIGQKLQNRMAKVQNRDARQSAAVQNRVAKQGSAAVGAKLRRGMTNARVPGLNKGGLVSKKTSKGKK